LKNSLLAKIHAVHNQNQILSVNEENENQILKPKQQQHGDLLQKLHTEQKKRILVLRPKPTNRHGDFGTQITKLELTVLRPKPGNPQPPWF
jgi:hypothetical protein